MTTALKSSSSVLAPLLDSKNLLELYFPKVLVQLIRDYNGDISDHFENLKPHGSLQGHTEKITALAYLPSGFLVSASEDHTLKIWNPFTKQCLRTLSEHTESIHSLAVFPKSSRFASASLDALKVWDTVSEKSLHTLSSPNIHTFAILSEDTLVFSEYNKERVFTWNLQTDTRSTCLEISRFIRTIMVLSNGYVVLGGNNYAMHLWHPPTKTTTCFPQAGWLPLFAPLQKDLFVMGNCSHDLEIWNCTEGYVKSIPDTKTRFLAVIDKFLLIKDKGRPFRLIHSETGAKQENPKITGKQAVNMTGESIAVFNDKEICIYTSEEDEKKPTKKRKNM